VPVKKRGPKSRDEIATDAIMGKLVVLPGGLGVKRLEPPRHFNERQKAIWREVIANEPAEFFDSPVTQALLGDYVCHRDSIEKVQRKIDEFREEWLKSDVGEGKYTRLLRLRENETRAASRAATRLRLTNQSRYTPSGGARAAARANKGVMPWEEE